jgi:acetyltransferase-like isoleucine patch superfamily enzyme
MNDDKTASLIKKILAGEFFDLTQVDPFPESLIPSDKPVWDILKHIEPELTALFNRYAPHPSPPSELDFWERTGPDGTERVVTVREGWVAEEDTVIPQWGMFFARGAVLEPTAVIKAPAFIGPFTEVRQGAYIRGNVIIGPRCTVGHATEIKSSLFISHSEAGHFAYIGDSILGSYVNIGAGSKLANLPFRTLDQKKNESFPLMDIQLENKIIPAGLSKIGAFLADGVETGCNCTLSPGTFLGKDSWIYPCLSIRKGYYPPRTIIKPGERPAIVIKRPELM